VDPWGLCGEKRGIYGINISAGVTLLMYRGSAGFMLVWDRYGNFAIVPHVEGGLSTIGAIGVSVENVTGHVKDLKNLSGRFIAVGGSGKVGHIGLSGDIWSAVDKEGKPLPSKASGANIGWSGGLGGELHVVTGRSWAWQPFKTRRK